MREWRNAYHASFWIRSEFAKKSRRAREDMAAYFILSVENADDKGGVSGLDLKELKPCAATANAMRQWGNPRPLKLTDQRWTLITPSARSQSIILSWENSIVDGNIKKMKRSWWWIGHDTSLRSEERNLVSSCQRVVSRTRRQNCAVLTSTVKIR